MRYLVLGTSAIFAEIKLIILYFVLYFGEIKLKRIHPGIIIFCNISYNTYMLIDIHC